MSGRTEKHSSHKEFEAASMEATAEQLAFQWVREAAEPAQVGERICAAILRASRNLGLSYGETKRYWYGERKALLANEFRQLEYRMQLLKQRRVAIGETANALDQRIAEVRGLRQLARETPSGARGVVDLGGGHGGDGGGTPAQKP